MTRTPLTVATHNTHDGAAVARPLGHVVVFTESIPVDRVLSQLGKGWAGMARHGVCIVWREVIFRAEKIKWTRAHDGERRLTPARGYWTLDGTHVASGQPVRIIATHMINGTEKRFVRRLSERRRLWRKHAAMIRASVAEGRKQGRLVIVAGDLNVHRLDVFGMRDAFRARRTYDHVLYTPDHRLHMRLARQGSRAGSDHRPLIASFNLDPAVDDDTGDTHQEAPVTVKRRGTDSSGRGIYASDAMWDWWTHDVLEHPRVRLFASKVVITQGAWMSKNGGGASGSAGYHDQGGAFDLRVWNLTVAEQNALIQTIRETGGPAWLRNEAHGGFKDPHIHLALGWDTPVDDGITWQVAEYKAGRNGLASRGADYHPRPNPLITTRTRPPQEDEVTPEDRKAITTDVVAALTPVIAKAVDNVKLDVGKKARWSDDTVAKSVLTRLKRIEAALNIKGDV